MVVKLRKMWGKGVYAIFLIGDGKQGEKSNQGRRETERCLAYQDDKKKNKRRVTKRKRTGKAEKLHLVGAPHRQKKK